MQSRSLPDASQHFQVSKTIASLAQMLAVSTSNVWDKQEHRTKLLLLTDHNVESFMLVQCAALLMKQEQQVLLDMQKSEPMWWNRVAPIVIAVQVQSHHSSQMHLCTKAPWLYNTGLTCLLGIIKTASKTLFAGCIS